MSADRRWTGGIANREWQRGTAPRAAEVVSEAKRLELEAQVKRYLADCRRFDLEPSERMALKIVFHKGREQAEAVRDAYARLIT